MSRTGTWSFGVGCLVVTLFLLDFSRSEKGHPSSFIPPYSFMLHATSSPAISYYDYIVVGGGTAGCPLAATLSRRFKVLLLERGGSPYGNSNITDMAHFADTLADTSRSSPSQRFVSEDGVINARARVLGGGSCINAGFYTHASADFVRKSGWDSELVNASYEWVEKVVAHRPPMLQWQSAMRDGLLEVGLTPNNGFTYDHIHGTKVGGTIFDARGNRHTAADLLRYADPARLTVLLYASTDRVLFRRGGVAKPTAHGVAYRDATGREHRAFLSRGRKGDVIISAGALGSPQLLMLSGVGPSEQLKSLGIDVVVDQPMVGQGMTDNPMNAIFVPSPTPVEVSLIQVVGITRLGTYIEGASGANFVTTADSETRKDFGMFSPQSGQLSTVPPKERTSEAIAEAVKAMQSMPASSFRGGFILEKIVGPLSSGHLELKNRDVDDNPKVTFNYFKEPLDLRRCVEGMKLIEKLVDSKAFSLFRYPFISVQGMKNITAQYPVNLRPRHDNDSVSMEQYCKDTVMTIWHYHGGCQVGRVVDRDYKVLGVDALRVVDGSTFNASPGTNPQATVMMLGRYVGMKIVDDRQRKK